MCIRVEVSGSNGTFGLRLVVADDSVFPSAVLIGHSFGVSCAPAVSRVLPLCWSSYSAPSAVRVPRAGSIVDCSVRLPKSGRYICVSSTPLPRLSSAYYTWLSSTRDVPLDCTACFTQPHSCRFLLLSTGSIPRCPTPNGSQ